MLSWNIMITGTIKRCPKELSVRLARRAGCKVELLDVIDVIDPVSRLLTIGVNVCKPPDAPTGSVLEISAVTVKQLVVLLQPPVNSGAYGARTEATYLLAADASDCSHCVGLHTLRCDRGPAILR